ncbi:Signal transduction histidine kinase [Pseudomonas cichorii]|uniref:Signal transduction histidine kinase n=1 Tax=Pseudomonas cichorii TaxID=36746 RepID=A0A3M4M8P1_PSECI|nr:sensor histidine kinase [Pseudomonas cichorii]RMQ50140.1 Signal transduction histidine kinase [Pseudomonas cichorii]
MHASRKLPGFRSLDTKNAQWLTNVLCTGAILGNIGLFVSSDTLPLALLALNLITFVSVWLAQLRTRQLIQLQPQELAQRMLEVQESERHRLSRELHDDIGQMLTAARIQCDWLQRRLPTELQSHGTQLNDILEETLDKVRDLSGILNPRQLSSLGLEASLRAHLLNALTDSQVRWSLECHQRLAGIPEEMAVAAFRITQEAVTNMLRHAHAKNLLVRLQRLPEGLSLFITDDGIGFEPAANPAHEGQRGIAGMAERVALLKGSWNLHSAPGNGTQIDILFPWAPRTHERANAHKNSQ